MPDRFWSDDTFDEVEADVSLDDDAAGLSLRLRAQQVRQAEQANDQRGWFFWVACGLAALTVLASVALVLSGIFGRPIAPAVAVAFMSGLAVQTIGVLVVIARYLFPRNRDE